MPQQFTADTVEECEDKITGVGGMQHRGFFPQFCAAADDIRS